MDERAAADEGNQASGDAPDETQTGQPGGIDVQQLADKVYRLAMAEARLARARGERGGWRGER
jgi:hypothetical protein